jgi:hypothetical protein
MRSLFVVIALAASLVTASATALLAQETLTNQSVVEMVKAGLSERVIIAKIRTSPTKFDTSTDALIALKKNGVSEKVIEAIMSPSAPPAAAAPAAPPAAAAGSVAMAPPPAAGHAPARPTVFLVVGGKEIELAASGGEVQRNRTPYSRSTELVIAGNKARNRTAERQPVFVVTSEPGDMPLVRLDPGKSDRNLKIGSGSRTPYAGSTSSRGLRSEDLIEVSAERDSRGFYRVKPRAPLAPGEYGFVTSRGGSVNAASTIYDFGVD